MRMDVRRTMFAGEHVLVTGGSGFIGRSIVPALLADGARVTVADRVAVPGSRTCRRSGRPLRSGGPRRRGDRRPRPASCTWPPSPPCSARWPTPPACTRPTSTSPAACSNCRAGAGCGRFVMASTNAVTGDIGTGTIHEGMPLRPLTPYGATKAAAEMLLSGLRRRLRHDHLRAAPDQRLRAGHGTQGQLRAAADAGRHEQHDRPGVRRRHAAPRPRARRRRRGRAAGGLGRASTSAR